MAEQAVLQQELDALAGLEDRVQKAVSLVESLRRERDTIARELNDSRAEMERLSHEVIALREERSQVRGRIEKLLGHIDQLSL